MQTPKEILIQPTSVVGETFNHIGDSFRKILADVEKIQNQNDISVQDALALQNDHLKYDFYQMTFTKIASKVANGINDVMKAQ